MDVKLVLQKGSTRGRVFHLRGEEMLVGRRQDCDLRIPSDQVSRRHCLLTVQGDKLIVEDLESVNGTFVNGKRIEGKQVVKPGDRLNVGPVVFRVEFDKPSAVRKTLPASVDPTQPEEEALDVLPLAEEEALDALPLAEDDDDAPIPVEPEDLSSAKENPSDSVLEALEIAEELDKNTSWHLPESNELRDILSDMDIDVDKDKSKKKKS